MLATRSDLVAKYKIRLSPYFIDWSKVTYLGKMQAEPYNEVTKSWRLLDNTVTIVMGDVGITLSLPDNVLSERMLLAMQTLKQACDATDGLGF